MPSNQQKPIPKQGPAATKDPEDPGLPSQRPSADPKSRTTPTNGTVVSPTKTECGGRDNQKQAAVNGATGGRGRKTEKNETRTTSTVDVSKEAAADAKVTGFWSFAGVNFGRMTRYMGSADSRQRLAGYWLAGFALLAIVMVAAIAGAAYTLISIYGNKDIAWAVGGGILTTGGLGVYLKHRRETSKAEDEDKD